MLVLLLTVLDVFDFSDLGRFFCFCKDLEAIAKVYLQ